MSEPTLRELKEAILSRIDFLSYYQGKVTKGDLSRKIRSDGWSERAHCPIHEDVKTPNFFINTKTGEYKCHGCNSYGSVFDFWLVMNNMKADNTNFPEALAGVAGEIGFDIKSWQKDYKPPVSTVKKEIAKRKEVDAPKLTETELANKKLPPIPETLLEEFIEELQADNYEFLATKRGLKARTIDKARIGYWAADYSKDIDNNVVNGRYIIPIPDVDERIRNLRRYSPMSAPAYKMLNYVQYEGTENERTYGVPARLYMVHLMTQEDWKNVVIVEGELDCLLLNQEFEDANLSGPGGWGAVTSTHGSGKLLPEWIPLFYDRNVYICQDSDEAGQTHAIDIINRFFLEPMKQGKVEEVKNVVLPLEGTKDRKDITDFFVEVEGTIEQFLDLCLSSNLMIASEGEDLEATTEAIKVDSFVSAIKDRRYIDRRIQVPVTICGQSSKTYHAARTYVISSCPLKNSGDCCMDDAGEKTIPYGDSMFIESCMERESVIRKALAAKSCIKEQKCKVQIQKKVVMEQYFAHQRVTRWRAEEDSSGRFVNSQELVNTPVYILQPVDNMEIQPQDYMATGIVRTHPKTSLATFLIEDMEPIEEDWQGFTVENPTNRKLIEAIKEFSVDEIIGDLIRGVTKIYQADEILYAVLLTFLSPLWISFNGQVMRGWINSAIIGDSGTGKSATYVRLSDWLDLGDLFSALSGSRTGLIYAVRQRSGGEWEVKIGRYVQASGKIIAVDETQEMEKEEIKKMGVAMQTGFLNIERVASGGYHTQTRTIFLMNPKNERGQAATIGDFAYGCDSMCNVFDPMMIRRLDFAVFTTAHEAASFYNKLTEEASVKHEMKITRRMMRALIHWAWTRYAHQVVWPEDSVKECLKQSTNLSEVYGSDTKIPLVNPQDFSENLARLASAYAILDCNFTEDLESVIVTSEHVVKVARLVNMVYSSPTCNLRTKSRIAHQRSSLNDYDEIKRAFDKISRAIKSGSAAEKEIAAKFLQMLCILQENRMIRKRDVIEQLNVASSWVNKRFAILIRFNLVEVKRSGFRPTKKFNAFMVKWRVDPDVDEAMIKANTLSRTNVDLLDEDFDEANFEANFDQPDYDHGFGEWESADID